MSDTQQLNGNPTEPETTNSPPTEPALQSPHSIFDKRQKSLIVLIVSTAATCEYALSRLSPEEG